MNFLQALQAMGYERVLATSPRWNTLPRTQTPGTQHPSCARCVFLQRDAQGNSCPDNAAYREMGRLMGLEESGWCYDRHTSGLTQAGCAGYGTIVKISRIQLPEET